MSSDELKTLRFQVFGRVQGVGFRWWTQSRARELGLAGSVRNLEDGSVEVIATGTSGDLDSLQRALQRGPPSARVERVSSSVAAESYRDEFKIIG